MADRLGKDTSEPIADRTRAIDTLEQATAYLDGLINRERSPDYAYTRLDLEPIRALLDGIGRPHEALSVIHVAGSKGKGSTCLFVEAILRGLGERVGVFTSPHLESWVERFRLDGAPVDPSRLVAAVERVRPVVERLRSGPRETLPSFFDATTAVAFLLFEQAGVDRAVIEVGLGGRLDSTNVVAPVVTCVTSIELEHTDKLGNTEAEIAGEKAGILKPGVPVVIGALRPEARQVVERRAAQIAAPTRLFGRDFGLGGAEHPAPHDFVFTAGGKRCFSTRLSAPGRAARLNAALAVECVRALDQHPPEKIYEAAATALVDCRLPARIEVLARDPAVIVDAAHTAESARALAAALVDLAPGGYDLLLSVSMDKNLDALIDALVRPAGRVWVTRADPSRSLPAERLAERISAAARVMGIEIDITPEPDPASAARRARSALAPGRRLVATGSVYLAGIARRVLGGGEPSPTNAAPCPSRAEPR